MEEEDKATVLSKLEHLQQKEQDLHSALQELGRENEKLQVR